MTETSLLKTSFTIESSILRCNRIFLMTLSKEIFSSCNQFVFIVLVLLCNYSCSSTKNTIDSNFTNENDTHISLINNGYIAIALRQYSSGHLRIDGTINGVFAKFLIDTGAGRTFIHSDTDMKFGLKKVSTRETASGAGGNNINMHLSNVHEINFSGFIISNFDIGLMNLNHINISLVNARQEPIDGIIGADILLNFKGIIDYNTLTLYLKNQQ